MSGLSKYDWQSIYEAIRRSAPNSEFVQGIVVSRDVKNRLVFIRELYDQPIPIIGFEYIIEYFDTQSNGTVTKRTATVKPKVPEIGETVLVALQSGEIRLPKCLGIITSTNFTRDDFNLKLSGGS